MAKREPASAKGGKKGQRCGANEDGREDNKQILVSIHANRPYHILRRIAATRIWEKRLAQKQDEEEGKRRTRMSACTTRARMLVCTQRAMTLVKGLRL